ncbi:MAG: hypothetical protein NPINA01_25570 [Nitrospinaceae bacterium]|nr:MAG: hypothetical protein NPINA01_25570 [Nitrospinaceae bacterium]
MPEASKLVNLGGGQEGFGGLLFYYRVILQEEGWVGSGRAIPGLTFDDSDKQVVSG